MRKLIFLLIASILVGSVCFAIMYLLFDFDWVESVSISLGVVGAGLVTEYLKSNAERKKRNRNLIS